MSARSDGSGLPDENASRLVHVLWQLDRHLTRTLDRGLEPLGLTRNQFGTLNRLMTHGPQSAADLARASGLRPQTIATTVAGLVHQGLVVKSPHPVHRRVQVLSVTSRGHDAWIRADAEVADVEVHLREVLGAEQTATLIRYVTDLNDRYVSGSDSDAPMWPTGAG